ncbi:MAG TPA: DUF1329 domain-containing protein [Solimonas sp.]|nr:DUF1329 domain-containing protein [Solimonas sp.]
MLSLILALAFTPALADQYRSEVRELQSVPAEKAQEDPQKLLKSITDPYAKALLLRELAGKAVSSKDYAKAAQLLEQAVATGALSGIAAQQMQKDLASLYMATGNYKKMLPQLEAQVKAGNAPPETLIALGAAYVEAKRFKDALPLLKKGVESSKKPDPSWRRALVAAMLGSGQEKEALPLLEQLLKEDPSQRDDWNRLAALHLKFGNKERALAVMEIASRLGFLQTGEDRMRLVSLTAQLGAPFEAGSLMQGWMQQDQLPANGANWRTLAGLWMAARESALAVSAIKEALEHNASAELYQQLAQLQMSREDYADAARALEQAIAAGSRDGNIFLTLGMARYQQADVDGALEAFREAGRYPSGRKLSADWVKYLESGKAREQALAAAVERQQHAQQEAARLSGRLLGGAVAFDPAVQAQPSARASGGDPFTPVGAERPGNADNSIPPWNGGLGRGEWPAAYKAGAKLADPYPNEQPIFTITSANLGQYRDRLSKGHQALFARYPGYTMPVYTTHRSVAFPQAIYDATHANMGKARLAGADALEKARLGFPFPRPQSGVEIMWNHRVRYRGDTSAAVFTQAVVRTSGEVQEKSKGSFRVFHRYSNVRDPVDIAQKNIIVYGTYFISESGRSPDYVVLFHETANSLKDPRNLWVLIAKLGRMMRIPPVGYDFPMPSTQSLALVDMIDMYNGPFDRYVWKLVGKREVYLPYNAYRLSDGRYKNAQLLKGGHFNQDGTRYELHRSWVIEATERQGRKHLFGKRTYYVDEDSWNIVLVENQDHEGNLWRFQEGHLLPLYDIQAAYAYPTLVYDLKDGRYLASGLLSEEAPVQYNLPMTENEFLPATVKNRYGR